MSNLSGKKINWTDYQAKLADLMWGEGGWFYDLEGCPTSNSQKALYQRAWEEIQPKIEGVKGTIFLFGTAGEMEYGAEVTEMFFNAAGYETEEHPMSGELDPYAPIRLKSKGFFIPCYKPKSTDDAE